MVTAGAGDIRKPATAIYPALTFKETMMIGKMP